MTEHHHEDEWEVEEAEATKPVGVVVSARLGQDLAERVYTESQRRGVPASVVVRDALDHYFATSDAVGATFELTVSSADVPIAFYSGRTLTGRTASAPNRIDIDQLRTGQLVISN